MKKLRDFIIIIMTFVIANFILVTPSYAEGDSYIQQDTYDGEYTIEDIISKYNVVTFEDIEKYKHIVGPVLTEGNLGTEGETIFHSHKTDGVSSCIKGEVVAGGNTNGDYQNTDTNLYVGTENTVEAYRASENETKELEVNEHYEADSYKVNNYDGYTKYMTVRTEDYFDFEKLKSNVIAEQANFAEGTTITKDENNIIYIEAGSTYTIDSLEGVSEIRISNLQMNDNNQVTLINIKDSGEIYMPGIADGNGIQFSTADYIGSVSNTMNMVWSIPNATKVVFGASAFVGHVIAPNANVEKENGNSAGCIICKNIKGEEIHYYPFNGRLEIPKEETISAKISKVDEDTNESVSGAHIQVLDALGNIIDEWDTADTLHEVKNLTPNATYTLRETTTPQGYKSSEDKTFTVDEDGNIVVANTTAAYLDDGTIVIKNKLLSTSVTITKHSETTDGETLKDAEYILYRRKIVNENEVIEYYKGTNQYGTAEWTETESEAAKKITNEQGIATFEGLTLRKSDLDNIEYFFKEVKAPKEHKLNTDPVKVEINANNYQEGKAIATKDQADEKIKVKTKVTKVDEDTNESVAGAHIKVFDEAGNVVDEWDTTNEAHEIENLLPNKKYTIKETTTPQGYKTSAEKTFMIDEEGKIVVENTTATYLEDGTLVIKNKLLTTSVTITKHSETIEGETLKDTDYILYRTKTENGTEKTEYYKGTNQYGVAEWTETKSDAEVKTTNNEGTATFGGITITKSDLDNTEYYFEEMKAPKEHEIDKEPVKVEISADSYQEGKAISGADQANKKIRVNTKITKIDEYTNEPVAGAHLQVIDEDGIVVAEWDTTNEAHKVEDLYPNKKYTLRETIAPQGYKASRDSIFTINEDGTINQEETDAFYTDEGEILVKNKPVTTTVKVTKHSEETGETLADSEYALYRTRTVDGETVTEYYMGKDENGVAMWTEDFKEAVLMTTNENGNAAFDGITIRKSDLDDYEYYVVETKAPEGYELNSTPIKVRMIAANYMDGVELAAIEHFNKKIIIPKADPIEEPEVVEKEKEVVSVKTGDNVSTYIVMAIAALTICILCSKVEICFKSRM